MTRIAEMAERSRKVGRPDEQRIDPLGRSDRGKPRLALDLCDDADVAMRGREIVGSASKPDTRLVALATSRTPGAGKRVAATSAAA